MKIQARFGREKVVREQEHEEHLVVSLGAPPCPAERKRSPVAVVAVLDVSGSMADRGKMEYARQTLEQLVQHLLPGDYAGLVTFTDEAKVVFPVREMAQASKADFQVEIQKLVPLASTNFSGGLLLGLEEANRLDVPAGRAVRVVILTDGLANRGVAITRADLLALLPKNLGRATVSAFGYGKDADQEMLADLARKGGGNYAFIENPEEALRAFGKELGGLLSTYAEKIEVEVAMHGGHEIAEVVSDCDVEEVEKGKKVRIAFRDLLFEEGKHLVFRVKLAAQNNPPPRPLTIADVTVAYEMLGADGTRKREAAEVKARLEFVPVGEEQKEPTKEVDAIVALAEMVNRQIQAEVQARAGNYAQAQSILFSFAENSKKRGHVGTSAAAAHLAGSYLDERMYRKNAGRRMSYQAAGVRGMSVACLDEEAASFLADAGVQLSNAVQEEVAGSFEARKKSPELPESLEKELKSSSAKGLAKSRSKRW